MAPCVRLSMHRIHHRALQLVVAACASLLLAPPLVTGARPSAAAMTSPGCSPARPHASGTSSQTITTPDGARTFMLHVPSYYTGSTAVPLIVNMHGARSNSFEEEIYSGFSTRSDADGFVVVYPQGLTTAQVPFTHWNAFQGQSPEPDDVAFINAVLDSVQGQLCIDPNNVFSTGISNGAMMSVRLACSLSSRIAAIAPVAGAYYPPDALNLNPFETCPDTRPVPMIAFHGTADTRIPYNGGPNSDATITYRLPIDDNTPAEDVMSDWSVHNGCTTGRQESQVSSEVRLVQYGACTNRADVQLYAVDGGGHTWPGSFDVPSLGYTTHQISATDLILAFFSAHPLVQPAPSVGGIAEVPDVPAQAPALTTSRSGDTWTLVVFGVAVALALTSLVGLCARRGAGRP